MSTAGDADSYSRESQLSDIVLSSCPTSPTLSTSSLCCTHPTRRHTGEGGLPWLTALHTIGDNLEEQRQHAGAVNLEDEYFVYDDAVISKNEARAKHWRLAGRKPAPMSIAVSNTSINTAAAAAAAAAATDYGTRRRSGTEASREELTKGTTSHSAGRFGLPSSMSLGDQVAERFPLRSASFSSPSGLAGVPMSVLKRQSTESSVSAFSFSDFEVCVDEMDIQLGVPGVTAHGENNIDGTRDGMSLAPSSSTAASSFALFYPNAGAPLSVLPPGPPSSWSPSGGVGGGGCINNGASGGAPATTTLLMVASANAFSGSGPPSLSESAAFPSSFSSSPSANESVPSAPSTGVPGAPAGSSAAAVLFLRNAVATATAAPRNDLTTLTDTTRLSERASLFGAAGLTANAMVPVVLTSGRPATHMEFNTGPEGDMEDLAGADARLSGDQQTRNNALSREDDPNTNSNTMYSLALSPTPASLAAAFSALSTRGAIRVNLNTTVTSTVSLAPNTVCALMQRQRSMAAKAHRPLRRLDLSTHLGHSARVKCIALSPAEREYVSCSNEDASVTLNSARNGTEIGIFTGHTDTVISAAYSPDGRYLATTSKDKTMILWDAMTAKQLHRLLHSKVVICSSFAPDSKYVVSGCQDRVCRIWDTRRGKEWLSFNKHEGIIIAVAFSPDGNQVCSASSDRTLRVWSASTAKARLTLTGHTGFILSCSYSSDGMRIISNDEEHVRVWSTVDGSCVLVVSPHDVVNRFVHPKDGVRTTLAAAAKSSSDTNTSAGGASGSTSNRLGWTLSRAAPGAFTDYMLVACNNRFVYLLDCKTGEEVTSVFCKAPVYCLAAGAGQLAACGDSFGNVYMLQFE